MLFLLNLPFFSGDCGAARVRHHREQHRSPVSENVLRFPGTLRTAVETNRRGVHLHRHHFSHPCHIHRRLSRRVSGQLLSPDCANQIPVTNTTHWPLSLWQIHIWSLMTSQLKQNQRGSMGGGGNGLFIYFCVGASYRPFTSGAPVPQLRWGSPVGQQVHFRFHDSPRCNLHRFVRYVENAWPNRKQKSNGREDWPTRKSSPWGNVSDGGFKSINQSSVDFHCKHLDWLIDWLIDWLMISQFWLDWFIGFVPHDLFLRGRG